MNIKNKLMVAVVMLVVSVLMMTTVSYAWFTISTAPEVSKLNAQVVANGNLEIALADVSDNKVPDASKTDDAGKNTTWGNIVDLSSITGLTLKPIGLATTGLQYPVYGADGRISKLEALTANADTTNNIVAYKIGTDGEEVWAVRVNLWIRSNVAGKVSLGEAADRGAGADGEGSYLKYKLQDDTLDSTNAVTDKVKVAILVGTPVDSDSTETYTWGTDFTSTTVQKLTASAENGKIGTLTGDVVDITDDNVNMCIPVSVLLYLDGETATNADMTNAARDLVLNLQFAHEETLVPMDPEIPAA